VDALQESGEGEGATGRQCSARRGESEGRSRREIDDGIVRVREGRP
jgi:hypothetical protein